MNNQLVKGSLSAIAQKTGQSLAETFMNCDCLLLVDMSSSMSVNDAPGGITRYEAAEQDVIKLQANHEGKVAVVVFSNYPLFCPNGKPERLGGGTELDKALRYIKPIDGCDVKIVLISDGEPFNQPECLRLAKTFETKIDVIYVGPEGNRFGGKRFLTDFAAATGGQFMQSDAPGLLADSVERLLLTA